MPSYNIAPGKFIAKEETKSQRGKEKGWRSNLGLMDFRVCASSLLATCTQENEHGSKPPNSRIWKTVQRVCPTDGVYKSNFK